MGPDRAVEFAKLCTALGEPKLPEQPDFRVNSDRLKNREELIALVYGFAAMHERYLHQRPPGYGGWNRCRSADGPRCGALAFAISVWIPGSLRPY